MRGSVARKIRKEIYGNDLSHKARTYKLAGRTRTIVDTGLRAKYQKAKENHKNGKK